MNTDDSSAEKTEQPTAKKLEDARKKGEIPKSNELIFASSLTGLLVALVAIKGGMGAKFSGALLNFISRPESFGANSNTGAALNASVESVSALWLIFLLPILAIIAASVAQRALRISPDKVTPKLRKISPISGAKNKFGAASLFEFLKSSMKLTATLAVLTLIFLKYFYEISNFSILPSEIAILAILGKSLELILYILATIVLIGIIDFVWQNSNHIRKNMMTRKEVEDEQKDAEGDPELKGRRRQKAQQIALSQVLAVVPDADVIIAMKLL